MLPDILTIYCHPPRKTSWDTKNLVEVIVVDAGGGDGTMEKVREAAEGSLSGLTLRTANLPHDSKGGRGATLIAGVAASKGDIILFLHADTVVLPGFDGLLRSELAKDSVLATAFSFGVNRDSVVAPIAGLAWMEWTVNIRSSILELPFGDQAIAMTRQRLDAVGGVPDVPIMEDFELVQKLRRIGAAGSGRIKTLDAKVLCSGRRWQEKGVWRTNLLNQVIMTAYVYFGFTPAQIYSWYYSVPFLRSGDGKTKAS